MQFRNLDLDSLHAKLNSFTMNVNDYEMVSPTLARVIITTTGNTPVQQEEIRASVARLFNGLASPVAESFRKVTDGVMAGFVKTNREVREYDEAAVTAGKMKVMSSNLLMDNDDASLWEIKEGSTGRYTVRQGNEDLSQLVHLACRKQMNQPTMAHLASMPAETKEFAAFVAPSSEEVEHGYVIASGEGKMTVMPFGADEAIEISTAQLVEVCNLDGEDVSAFGSPMAAECAASKEAMIEYYRKAYVYAPDYVQKIIEIINQHSVA